MRCACFPQVLTAGGGAAWLQACVRVCLRNLKDKTSHGFLEGDCNRLAEAFGLQELFLQTPAPGASGEETGVIWSVAQLHRVTPRGLPRGQA